MSSNIGSTFTTSGQHSTPEGAHGPHSSRVANALDPRVDSDRDGSHTVGTGAGHNLTSGHHGVGSGVGSGPAPNTAGPHQSDMLNRMDPRVDSDRDNSRTLGGNPPTGTNVPEGTYGHHNSRIANAADPRIDSDHDRTTGLNAHGTSGTSGISTLGGTTAGHGLTGTHGTHGTSEGLHGPHGSRVANALDPRVDSDRDHGAAHTGSHATSTGDHVAGAAGAALGGVKHTGPAPNTAGPHSHDILNKLDPRVDSDLDGSKTIGGNKTFAQS